MPSLATITAACDRLDAANQAVLFNGGKLAYTERDEADKELRDLIKELAGYVQAVSKGDKPQVQDGAFDVVEPGEPIGELPPPQALGSKLTNMSGRVALDWKGVRGAKSYQVFMSTSNDPFKWELTAVTTKSRLDVDSLEPGTFYWFAVSAVGAAGTSSKSDPAQAMAA
ncbi:MAG: fibronectin type III domain-containing protein [Flavobacteriales bacterium]|nr:fibronectin type III domain-containing protein [Flavobacteriales bacterium]